MSYTVGKGIESWKSGKAQTITFIVTDDCNLRCKYCYVTHKCADKRMNFETAKKFVDYILAADIKYEDAVILEFIGGEPMLEAELISQIVDYFKVTAFMMDHPWYWNYRISICTNGVNYSSKPVQNLILRNYGKISVTITLDGTKEKHDMQRVFPDGSGSFDVINDNIDLWLSQFSGNTKVTFASDDLPLLKDSIISLWNRGITQIASNVVFEDVWKEGDDKILEEQLISLADYILENKLYDKGYVCTFFDETIGFPYDDSDLYKTYCGAGKMLAVSSDGRLFPCLRFYGHSLNNHEEWPVGALNYGIDMERVRPFMTAAISVQSDSECLNCPIATGCGFCQGFNYDNADTPTNFHRAKYICKMHKARVRANNYYFAKLKNMYGIRRESGQVPKKNLYILLSDDYVSYCAYDNQAVVPTHMDHAVVLEALKYASENFMRPVFVHSKSEPMFDFKADYMAYDILHIVSAQHYAAAKKHGLIDILPVFELATMDFAEADMENCVLSINEQQVNEIASAVHLLLNYADRVNLNITGLTRKFNETVYEQQLQQIKDRIIQILEEKGALKEFNLLTDICLLNKHENCQAGENNFALGRDSMLYVCPAFYSAMKKQAIGNLQEGIIRKYDARLYESKNNVLCRDCDAFHCRNCVFTNVVNTNEVNVSPSFQCRKAHIERRVSRELLEVLKQHPETMEAVKEKSLEQLEYLDPIKKFFDQAGNELGTYKYKID